jgi:ribonucleoside-diphosphate reductase alpha chain
MPSPTPTSLARVRAGAVYLHAHHPDILRFLDTKRENADEKIRIKTLSLGVVIPDITFKLAKEDARDGAVLAV